MAQRRNIWGTMACALAKPAWQISPSSLAIAGSARAPRSAMARAAKRPDWLTDSRSTTVRARSLRTEAHRAAIPTRVPGRG